MVDYCNARRGQGVRYVSLNRTSLLRASRVSITRPTNHEQAARITYFIDHVDYMLNKHVLLQCIETMLGFAAMYRDYAQQKPVLPRTQLMKSFGHEDHMPG